MLDRKNKRTTEEPSPIEIEQEPSEFTLEPARIQIGSAYTLTVNYQNETPIINVKTYGKIDTQKMRQEILRAFPNAEIRTDKPRTITIAKKNVKKH